MARPKGEKFSFKKQQTVIYIGGSRSKWLKAGDEVVVKAKFGGGRRFQVRRGDRTTVIAGKYLAADKTTAMRPAAATTTTKASKNGGKNGGMVAEPTQRVYLTTMQDPIKVAKETLANTEVLVAAEPKKEKLEESPVAILAMFNALLELKAAGVALGGENRRKAWHRMVTQQIQHGELAQQLR